MISLENYFFNPQAVPLFLVSTLILATGTFVFIQNKTQPSNIFFFLFCLSLNFWLYGRVMMYCSKEAETALLWARRFAFLGVAHISPFVYAFTVHWLNHYQKQKPYLITALILAPIFYLLTLLTPHGIPTVKLQFWGYYPVYGIVCKVFIAFFFTYFIGGFYNFYVEVRKDQDPIRKKQIQLIFIAFLISITAAFDYLPKITSYNLYPFGYLCVLVWTMIVAYTIVRYRAMDIQTVVHKTIMWFLSSFVVVMPFAFILHVTHDWISLQTRLTATACYLALTLGFYVYFRTVFPAISHFFRRRRDDLQGVLDQFAAELVHLKNLRDLLKRFVRMLQTSIYAKQISIYIKDEEMRCFVPAIAKGVRGYRGAQVTDPFLIWLRDKDAVLIKEYVWEDPATITFRKEMRTFFKQTKARVLVPFVLSGDLVGVLALGPKENLKKYNSVEIEFLSNFRRHATIALSNALHLIAIQENLKKWNEELEKKVTERTQQLEDTQAQLVQSEKMATIGTLAGGVAHEINNPLTAVLSNAQLLKMTATAEDMDSIDLIEAGAKRCQIIIQKLMKYARKAPEKETIARVDMATVIKNVAAMFDYQVRQDNIELLVEVDHELPVEGVAVELEQVLTNMIINAKDAIKAANRQGKIRIRGRMENEKVVVQISDNGVGIKDEIMKKIFDPFFTTKDVGSGTGLGLAVTHSILKKHACDIKVETKLNEGTTFLLEFKKKNHSGHESQVIAV